MTLQNRIAELSEDAAAIPAPFRPEEFALTECSDTEFCEWVARPSRRLRLMWNPSVLNEEAPMDSHDQGLACVRRVVHRERRDRGSPGSISSLWSSNVLGSSTWEERRPEKCECCEGQSSKCPSRCGLLQRVMKNVPYWDGCVTERRILPPMVVDNVEVPAREALRIGWNAFRDTMRSWGIGSREDLAERTRGQGFVRPRWVAHFGPRIQEIILDAVVVRHAWCAALESFYVHLVLQACSSEQPVAPPEARQRVAARAPAVGDTQWSSSDDIRVTELSCSSEGDVPTCTQSCSESSVRCSPTT